MTIELSDRVNAVPPSGIRRFFEIAGARRRHLARRRRTRLLDAMGGERRRHRLEQGKTSYTANRGKRELREAIADYAADRFDLGYDPDEEIIVTAGASEAVDLAFRALVDPGDTVAIAQPSYISYEPGVVFAGGEVLPVPTREDEFRLTVETLEAAGASEADLLVLCYPNNPTGAIMRESDLEPVAEFAREHDLTVLSDEIYAELTYEVDGSDTSSGGTHTSIATLPGMRERTVVFNGFEGPRDDWPPTGVRTRPADVVGAMNRIHQYTMLSAPTTAQYAALEALESCDDEVKKMVDQYDRRRRFVLAVPRDRHGRLRGERCVLLFPRGSGRLDRRGVR